MAFYVFNELIYRIGRAGEAYIPSLMQLCGSLNLYRLAGRAPKSGKEAIVLLSNGNAMATVNMLHVQKLRYQVIPDVTGAFYGEFRPCR